MIPKGKCIVLFTSQKCPSCFRVKKLVDKAGLSFTTRIIDCNAHPSVAARYGVQSTPTLMLMHDGMPLKVTHKSMTEAQFERWLCE